MAEKIFDDVETLEVPATVEPVNSGDDVRNDVAAAIKQLKGPAEPEAVEEALDAHPEPIEAKPDDRPRDPSGKFIPKDAAPKEAAAPDPKLPPVDNTAKPSTEQPSTAVSAAPVSWAAEAKASWAALPPAIQNAVIKREAEVSNGFRQKSEEVRRYEGMIAPVAQEAARLGMPPEQAINALMAAHHSLQRNAPAAIAQLAAQYGVDLATLASNPPAAQTQQFDPMVSQLTQTVSSLADRLDQLTTGNTVAMLDGFAKTHPHFSTVRSDMGRIFPTLPPELSETDALERAYEQAIWGNPEIRSQLIAEQTTKTQQTAAQAVQSKAQQASRAAVSIRGSSNGAHAVPKVVTPQGDSVYDDVRAALHQLRQ